MRLQDNTEHLPLHRSDNLQSLHHQKLKLFFFSVIFKISFLSFLHKEASQGARAEQVKPGCTPSGWAVGWCPWQLQRRNGCFLCLWHMWNGNRWFYHCRDLNPQTSWGWTRGLPVHPSVGLQQTETSVNGVTPMHPPDPSTDPSALFPMGYRALKKKLRSFMG